MNVICDYGCYQKSDMKLHVASVHEGKKPIKCDICDYGFYRKSDIKLHAASVHGGKK